ncbi:MAG TPA: hypothetical protein VNT79_01080 [Phycisphaerae bacterium]|nr:hypothetical protein [Phycisphaerae bacterium]
MTELPIQQILLDAVSVLERLRIPYAIMGGFAARAWGLPRPTYDADIAIAAGTEELQKLFDGLEQEGFDIPPEHRTGFLDVLAGFKKAKVNRFVDRNVWHTDFFLAQGEFLNSALARARETKIGLKTVRVMAPEDIILLKLIASRRKDLADIEEIMGVCRDLDVPYLRNWAKSLGVADRLAEFFPQS